MDQATKEIETPHDNDVLFGRGNSVNSHPGNIQFRSYVSNQREEYARNDKKKKPIFARLIVNMVRNLVPPGRFLIQDNETKLWSDVGDKKAWDKTRQALRDVKSKEKPSEAKVSSKPPLGTNEQTKQMPESLPASTNSTITANELRLMFSRQLEAAHAMKQTNDTWLSEANADASIDLGEKSGICIRNQDGKAIPLRSSFIGGYTKDGNMISKGDKRKGSLKLKPKYSDTNLMHDSMGTFSIGQSLATGLSADPTYATNTTGISYGSNTTASCSSGPSSNVKNNEPNEGGDDASMHNNSLFLEGLMTQTSSTKSASVPPSRKGMEKGISVISGLTEETGLTDLHASKASGMGKLKRTIDEGTEDGSSDEDQDTSNYLSVASPKTDEDISMKSSVHPGRRNSTQSNIDDLLSLLSGISGKMSIDSFTESGVFSLSQAGIEDWNNETMEWEREAESKDNLRRDEELKRLEKNFEEVENMNEMFSMTSMMCDL